MSKLGKWELIEHGVRRKIISTGKGLMMVEVQFEGGAEGEEHRHIQEQMSYCLYGRVLFTVDGEEHLLSQGDALYIRSGAIHRVRALEQSGILDTFTPIREDVLREGSIT